MSSTEWEERGDEDVERVDPDELDDVPAGTADDAGDVTGGTTEGDVGALGEVGPDEDVGTTAADAGVGADEAGLGPGTPRTPGTTGASVGDSPLDEGEGERDRI